MLNDVHDKSIDEQGERMVPAFHKGALVYGEHITRYEAVADLVKGKIILDIASGSGYGSYIMGGHAKKVFGVDIDEDSVKYATRNYKRPNIEYRQGSAEEIPLDDDSVEVVVTFETLEHIKDYEKFIKEIKRVLKPGGYALISTPNDPEFPEDNHFHLHEFREKELEKLLKKYFKYTDFSYQYTWYYTALLDKLPADKEWLKPLETYNVAPVKTDKALYFMVVCSDTKLPASAKIKELAAISEHYSARQVQVETKRIKAMEADVENLRTTLAATRQELQSVYDSKGWRLLAKAHSVKAKFKK